MHAAYLHACLVLTLLFIIYLLLIRSFKLDDMTKIGKTSFARVQLFDEIIYISISLLDYSPKED